MVYGKEHSYKLGTMYNLIKWTTERGGSVRLSTVTSWLTGPESCCCLHLRKRLVSFVTQEPRSCSLDFHLSIRVLTSSQSFHLLKGKDLGQLGMRLFEFGSPGRSRLLSHTNATEKKPIRCSVKTIWWSFYTDLSSTKREMVGLSSACWKHFALLKLSCFYSFDDPLNYS